MKEEIKLYGGMEEQINSDPLHVMVSRESDPEKVEAMKKNYWDRYTRKVE